jgi:predicted nuclease of restriction endonuclease-like (RecB) superfamily
MTKKTALLDKTYLDFVHEIKNRIISARIAAARAVNRDLILLYWDIGKAIVQKQKELSWGESVVEMLSKDLKLAFPGMTGFSGRNLRAMKQFYETYAVPEFWQQAVAKLPHAKKWQQAVAKMDSEFLQQLVAEIPWGHHLLILNKTDDPAARLYYMQATAKFGWSRNVLLNQIKAKAFERAIKEKKTHNFPIVLPEYLAEQADEALKSSYNLEFLGIHHEIRERELEDRLIERLREFILELGYGFCFIGRQYRLAVGKKEYFVDLLFYHRFLKALVAVELKVGEFEPEYAGKMDFYLNLLNEREKADDDNPSIGIILCAEKDDMVVEFSLKSKMNPIGVAEYQLTKKLPKDLKGKLPSERQLKAALLLETSQRE